MGPMEITTTTQVLITMETLLTVIQMLLGPLKPLQLPMQRQVGAVLFIFSLCMLADGL